MISDEQLVKALQCPVARAGRWRPALVTAMRRFDITSPRRIAHFLAQIGHESLSLSRTEESLSYSRPRLLEVFGTRIPPHCVDLFVYQPEKLGNFVYALRNGNGNVASGDGHRYRGRGPVQLTGRGNYRLIGEFIGMPLEAQPRLLIEVEAGALSAAAYWKNNGLNTLADSGDVLMVSRKINLGSATVKRMPEGLSDRIARTHRALTAMGAT